MEIGLYDGGAAKIMMMQVTPTKSLIMWNRIYFVSIFTISTACISFFVAFVCSSRTLCPP